MARVVRRKCAKCNRNRAEKFFVSARGRVCSDCKKRRVKFASREVRLFETYGITLEEYEQMAANGCNICGGKRRGSLDVDHDHAVERALIAEGVAPLMAVRRSVRGVLCRSHNRRLLPSVRDNVGILYAAIAYLDDPPALYVLGAELPPL